MGLGDGFCRTASGARGTFTVASTATIEECQAACSAQPTCVGVEFRPGTCELHTESQPRRSVLCQGVTATNNSTATDPICLTGLRWLVLGRWWFPNQLCEPLTESCSSVGR